MTWKPDIRESDTKPLETAVFQAVGAASACWEDLDKAGVFDSEQARQIGLGLIAWLRAEGYFDRRTGGHFRDAGSGEFVTEEFAQQHPDTTVRET